MPDSAKNFTLDSTNGPIGTTTVTRDELITALEHLNYAEGYNIRAIDELGATGIVSVDSLGNANACSIAVSDGLSVANATGISGNPTIGIGTPATVRQTITDTEANAITANPAVSILSTGNSYTMPSATSGVITQKHIINDAANMITLIGSVWADAGVSNVRIPPEGAVILTSNLAGKWHVVHPQFRDVNGLIYISTPGTTATAVQNQQYPENSVYTLGSNANQFALDSSRRLKYTGKVPASVDVHVSFSCALAAGTGETIEITIGHYDDSGASTTYLAASEIDEYLANSTDVSVGSAFASLVMEENDYVFIGLANENVTPNSVAASNGVISARGQYILTT